MAEKYRGNRRWNGSYGKLWWDGDLVFEIHSFEATVKANREDVLIGTDVDSKIVSLTGEGKITIKSVVNRNLKKVLEAWKAGKDLRFTFVGLIDDPDAIEGQKERVVIDNAWLTDVALMSFEKGKVVEKEFAFGFTPSDAEYVETID